MSDTTGYDNGGIIEGPKMMVNKTGEPIKVYPMAQFTEEQAKVLRMLDAVQPYDVVVEPGS